MSIEDKDVEKIQEFKFEQFLKCIYVSLGRAVEITLINDKKAYGIFSGMEINRGIIKIKNYSMFNSKILNEEKIVELNQIKFFSVKEISFTNSQGPSETKTQKAISQNKSNRLFTNTFNTDIEISKHNNSSNQISKSVKSSKNKVFQKFSLEGTSNNELLEEAKDVKFNQFEDNKKAFNIGEEFNEDEYTTKLNINEFTLEEIKNAEKQALDIINSSVSNTDNNRHLLEERGLMPLQDNENEEALYSAVIREKESEPAPKICFKKKILEPVSNKDGSFSERVHWKWKEIKTNSYNDKKQKSFPGNTSNHSNISQNIASAQNPVSSNPYIKISVVAAKPVDVNNDNVPGSVTVKVNPPSYKSWKIKQSMNPT